MAKILLVDDEPDIEFLAKQKFRKQIASGAFEIFYAQNGQKALDLIKEMPDIIVVVSDVNMPEMDGLTLLDKLKEISPMTKTIVVSAYGDMKTLRSAMNRGVFDFVTKPVDYNELAQTIERTLALYYASSSLLYPYQLLLCSRFPKGVDLTYPHAENALLWDVLPVNSQQLILMGVSILHSPIPMDISVSVAHGALKIALKENPEFSLEDFEKKLSLIHSDLKAHVWVGYYHEESHAFSYKTSGDFNFHHMTKMGKFPLLSSEVALLDLGDEIRIESPASSSSLTFTCSYD